MSGRRRIGLIILGVIGALLLACVASGVFGVVFYLMSGGIDIPYPDGPPPTPSGKP
ncbi:MAG TPA: hypothetical protein VIL85_04940 [Thermomicrobiales bacterium]|jgi:hypothetical protein